MATAKAVIFTTRRTVAEGVMMWAAAAAPSKMGPTVTPWADVILSTLNRMLALSRLGQISRLASPCSVVSDKAELAQAAHERDAAAKERDAAAKERDAALVRAEALAAQLRAAGIDPA